MVKQVDPATTSSTTVARADPVAAPVHNGDTGKFGRIALHDNSGGAGRSGRAKHGGIGNDWVGLMWALFFIFLFSL